MLDRCTLWSKIRLIKINYTAQISYTEMSHFGKGDGGSAVAGLLVVIYVLPSDTDTLNSRSLTAIRNAQFGTAFWLWPIERTHVKRFTIISRSWKTWCRPWGRGTYVLIMISIDYSCWWFFVISAYGTPTCFGERWGRVELMGRKCCHGRISHSELFQH